MLVKKWMSTKLITVNENTSMMKALRIMKDNRIRRLPVMKDEKLVGIITDRDLKEASPSKASTLDVHELYYLLSEIRVKDIMAKNPITIRPDESVEKAAVLMLEKKISGLPVVENENLVGIITQTDIFRVLTSITGIYQGGIKIALDLPDIPGTTQAVINTIRSHGGRIMSVMTSYDVSEEGHRHVFVRTKNVEGKKLDKLLKELNKHFYVLYSVKDVI
ncbi:MAG TPA: CBS domain-containing protein [Syntrophaceae bacterium]|nr:CBS domain-containing protein [Syntrophaceae bacterium]